MSNYKILKELEARKCGEEGWLDRLRKANGFQTKEDFSEYRNERIAKDNPKEELKFDIEYYLGRLSVLYDVIELIKEK